ncbi:MAG: nucleotidyltransferase family protein [Desulfovibrionaceae bacterium]
MKDWKDSLISLDASIVDALRIISRSRLQIALVIDENRKLLGTVTDGDIRNGLLSGRELQDSVTTVMFPQPTVARIEDSDECILGQMQAMDILQIPLVDDQGRIVGLKLLKEFVYAPERNNLVVLMAGGLGSRLGPITEECPKPLLKVGNKPILETIVLNFIQHGFRRFKFSVNYMAEMIENHFRDGSRWGAQIEYVRESIRLGTAGALALLPDEPDRPFFVMNGDILTSVNFSKLLEAHEASDAAATMCVREYEQQIPYGVVRHVNNRILSIDEKPVTSFHVNAGIYVLDPACLEHVPRGVFFDMTDLFSSILAAGMEARVFPVSDYWIDIGRMDDLKRAHGEYCKYVEENGKAAS